MGFLERLKDGLSKTRRNFTDRIEELVGMSAKVDEDFLEELEMILLSGDVGVKTTEKLIDAVRQAAKKKEIEGRSRLCRSSKNILPKCCRTKDSVPVSVPNLRLFLSWASMVLVKPLLSASWPTIFICSNTKSCWLPAIPSVPPLPNSCRFSERAGCEVIRHEEGADPAAVVFDAVKAAIARNVDVLFIDTAGRLHNKTNLMNELEKVHRIIKREIPEAPHETFLVLDATTGQNAINQAKVFMETANVTGVVLTKLDGTAKGGVVIAIKEELGLPVKWIGVGEGIMDFRPFEADKFVDALFDGDK